ncbi:NAD-dependent epimerase/dehydratase family protein [Streptomyces marincola]|uniref:NAD-dependent epimerase/dehydratase family protein n=1 Tax=Streptomyces marincola TaxID=2878388 RepID=UPI0034CE2106
MTFSRGRSGTLPAGAEAVHGDRTSPRDLARLADSGTWDAVIDTSSADFAPRHVLTAARALEPVARRYVYVSTVNAYAGWPREPLTESSPVLDVPADADEQYGSDASPAAHYGMQKAGSERAVHETFGAARTVLLRPGVILGPGEYVGRLPWWLRRTRRGGTVLAPGRAERTVQPVDVRDAAGFALDRAADRTGGTYNVVAPGRETMGDLLTACLDVTGGRGRLRWVPDEVLIEHGVRQWTELPLWRTAAGVWAVEGTRARDAGLRCRPIGETVAATWAWLHSGGTAVAHPRAAEHGIAPGKEAAILAAFDD